MEKRWSYEVNYTVHFFVTTVSNDSRTDLFVIDCAHVTKYISRYILMMALVPPGPAEPRGETYANPPADFTEIRSSSPKRKSSSSPKNEIQQGPVEKRLKPSNGTDVRTLYPRDDRFVYGNPKDLIKSPQTDAFDSSSVLDLSCKTTKLEEEKSKPNDVTYHNYPRNNNPFLSDPFPRSNLEIKLVNPPKRPSPTEQLQIAKLQQQQRRSVQQQQKMLQQMRRSLEAGGRSSTKPEVAKEESHPSLVPPAFSHNPLQQLAPIPYMDNASKELPDGHPVLPLLDPVYFSALYNAHGFLPPSSPSIAAAFIGTLQDALPKLSMMFPPTTSASGTSLLHQKGNDNHN